VYHLYVIRSSHRDALKKHLADAGVTTVLNYPKALPFYPAYAYLKHTPSDFPVAFEHQSRILSLPIFPELSADMRDYTVDCIRGYFASLSPR
jgi:dTDP-4-amino-4,6-dideoxygalactose transaminase